MFVVDRVVKKLYRYMKRKLGPSKSWSLELADGTSVEVSLSGVSVGQSDPSDDLIGEDESSDRDFTGGKKDRDELTGKDSVKQGDGGKSMRESSYKGDSESKIAGRATENRMIFSDVMSDPSLVGADSDVEAVARVAVANPGWASMVDFEADLGVDPGSVDSASGDADASAGESRHGSSGEGSPSYSPGADASDVGSEPGTVDGVETGASIDTGSGSVSTGNSVGGSGSGGDGGGGGGNSV